MMFDNNPYGAAQFGMMAEIHRTVSGELDAPNETATEKRPNLFSLLSQVWSGLGQRIPPLKTHSAGFDNPGCSPVENLESSC